MCIDYNGKQFVTSALIRFSPFAFWTSLRLVSDTAALRNKKMSRFRGSLHVAGSPNIDGIGRYLRYPLL
jgi:hypothetical protein